jgi:hypothetical protein
VKRLVAWLSAMSSIITVGLFVFSTPFRRTVKEAVAFAYTDHAQITLLVLAGIVAITSIGWPVVRRARRSGTPPPPPPEVIDADRDLYRQFIELLPSDGTAMYLLQHHDFGGSFERHDLDDLRTFAIQWTAPEFEFLDEEIDKRRLDLIQKAGHLFELIAVNTWPHDVDPKRQTIALEWETTDPERFHSTIGALNQAADHVVSSHAEPVRTARKRLKIG